MSLSTTCGTGRVFDRVPDTAEGCQTTRVRADSTYVDVKVSQLTNQPLALTVDRQNDCLYAIEFGKVIDGKCEDEYVRLDDSFAYVLDEPFGDMIGFVVDGLDYDLYQTDAIWQGPEFVVPALPLGKCTAGELVAAALALYSDTSTADAQTFHMAVSANEGHDIDAWILCLGTGELKAHFGLGYTYWEHGHFAEAYTHLRHYTTLVPRNAWAWCWFGKACGSLGELGEAREAFERALEIEREGGVETDAGELLASLD